MKLTVIEYGGRQRQIDCESFEFRTNQVTNWIRVIYVDGRKEELRDVAVIKSGKDEPMVGHWKRISDVYICDRCKCEADFDEDGYYELSDFCPNCGADMSGKRDD